MEFLCEPDRSKELRGRRFWLCGDRVSFSDLCSRGFRPSELKPVEYVELLWEEA